MKVCATTGIVLELQRSISGTCIVIFGLRLSDSYSLYLAAPYVTVLLLEIDSTKQTLNLHNVLANKIKQRSILRKEIKKKSKQANLTKLNAFVSQTRVGTPSSIIRNQPIDSIVTFKNSLGLEFQRWKEWLT